MKHIYINKIQITTTIRSLKDVIDILNSHWYYPAKNPEYVHQDLSNAIEFLENRFVKNYVVLEKKQLRELLKPPTHPAVQDFIKNWLLNVKNREADR